MSWWEPCCLREQTSKNAVKERELLWMAFIFWQIVTSNIIPQVGHLNELSTFVLYTLWKIHLPFLIFNHINQCRNQRRAYLLYVRLLTSLFLSARKNLIQGISSTLTLKTLDHNRAFYKVILRDNKRGRQLKHHSLGHNWRPKLKMMTSCILIS